MGAAEEQELARLLAGRSSQGVRVAGVEALKRWHEANPAKTVLTLHGDLGRTLVGVLAGEQPPRVDAGAVKEVFLYGQHLPVMGPLLDFLWWLIRAGLARPGHYSPGGAGVPAGLVDFHLTAAGIHFLDAAGDHPLAPDFIQRLRARHPEIPDEVVVLIEDAQACLDVSLLRPAVVLLGVAYEGSVQGILMVLAGRGIGDEKFVQRSEAGERIGRLNKLLGKLKFGREDRRLAESAVDFADHLRDRRNDATHSKPRWAFDSMDEVEELLVSAGRHLPHLWTIAQAPVAEQGGGEP